MSQRGHMGRWSVILLSVEVFSISPRAINSKKSYVLNILVLRELVKGLIVSNRCELFFSPEIL